MDQRCVLSSSSYTAREGARGQRRNKRCRKWMACVRFEYLMIHYANPHRLLLQTPYNEENYFSFFFFGRWSKNKEGFQKQKWNKNPKGSLTPAITYHPSFDRSFPPHIHTGKKEKFSRRPGEHHHTALANATVLLVVSILDFFPSYSQV